MAKPEELIRRTTIITNIPEDVNIFNFIKHLLRKHGCQPFVCVRSLDSNVGNHCLVLLQTKEDKDMLVSNRKHTFEGYDFTIYLRQCPLSYIPKEWTDTPPNYTSIPYTVTREKLERRTVIISGIPKAVDILMFINHMLVRKLDCKPYVCARSLNSNVGNHCIVLLQDYMDKPKILPKKSYRYQEKVFDVRLEKLPLKSIPNEWLKNPPDYTLGVYARPRTGRNANEDSTEDEWTGTPQESPHALPPFDPLDQIPIDESIWKTPELPSQIHDREHTKLDPIPLAEEQAGASSSTSLQHQSEDADKTIQPPGESFEENVKQTIKEDLSQCVPGYDTNTSQVKTASVKNQQIPDTSPMHSKSQQSLWGLDVPLREASMGNRSSKPANDTNKNDPSVPTPDDSIQWAQPAPKKNLEPDQLASDEKLSQRRPQTVHDMVTREEEPLFSQHVPVQPPSPLETTESPRVLQVTEVPEKCTEDSLLFYFENKRNSNGGEVFKVELNKITRTALVHFKKTSDAERVLMKQNHILEGQNLKVSKATTECLKDSCKSEKPNSDDVHVAEEDGDTAMTTGIKDSKSEKPNSDELAKEVVEEDAKFVLEVRGCSSTEEVLHLYLEDPKRGGGVTVKHIERREGVVYVTLASQKEIETVLQRRHELEKDILEVTEHQSKPRYLNRFLFTNLNKTTSRSSLKNFLEAKTKRDVLEIFFGEQPGVALAKFDSKQPELLAVLKAGCAAEALDNNHLLVSTVEVSSTIAVNGVDSSISLTTVKSHFENKRCGNKWQSSVEVTTRGSTILVEFENFQVANAVLLTQQKLGSTYLRVDLYIEKLGLGQREGPKCFKQPESFSLELLEGIKCNFLKEKYPDKMKKAMLEYYTEVIWQSVDSAFLKCTLTENVPQATQKAETWKQDAESCFRKEMDKVKVIELTTLSDIWKEVAKKLSELVTFPERVGLYLSCASHHVSVVGYEQDASDAALEVKEVIKGVEDNYQKKKKEVTERVDSLKPGFLTLLLKLNIEDTLKKDHDDVAISIDEEHNVIEFKGQILDIVSCRARLFEKVHELDTRYIMDLSKKMLAFIAREQVKKALCGIIDDNGVVSIFYVDTEKVTVLSASEEMTTTVEKLIKDNIEEIEEDLSPENAELLSNKEWSQLTDNITNRFGDLVNISANSQNKILVIISMKSFAEEVKEQITSFLNEQSVYCQVIKIPQPIFTFLKTFCDKKLIEIANNLAKQRGVLDYSGSQMKLIGCKEGLSVSEKELMALIKTVIHQRYTMTRPGIGKYIYSDRIKFILTDTEKTSTCIIALQYDEKEGVSIEGRPVDKDRGPMATSPGVNVSQNSSVFRIDSHRQVVVMKGDITTLNVDVIVNAANEDLQHAGGLAKEISDKGGPVIDKESKAYIAKHKKVLPGSAAATGPGLLPCKKILHAVGPIWSGGQQGEEATLKNAIMDCLEQTSRLTFTSIALPTLSAGIYRYPENLATRHIVEAIENFFTKECPNSSITHVYLVDIISNNVMHFNKVLRALYPGMQSSGTRLSTMETPFKSPSHSEIKINLLRGEIAKQQADVIVSSVAGDLDLSKGAVSKTILEDGGQSLQAEVNNHYPHGIKPGQVAVSSGGNLQCGQVYHACLPDWDSNGAQTLKTIMMTCLKKASDTGHSTVAFPVLGAGVLSYPHDVVAQTFYKSVAEFEPQNRTLSHVTFVVYPSDTNILSAFQKHQRETTQGRYQSTSLVYTRTSNQASHSSPIKSSLKVELVKGEIAKQKTDVIVNSVANNMDIQHGLASKSILEEGGDSLQQELKKNYPHKLNPGDIAVTSGGNLHCRNVYHTHLVGWNPQTSPKILHDLVVNCLKKADESGHRSIAFPVLGAGNLNFPRDVVAGTMYKAFTSFESTRKSLEDVIIVIFGMDSQEEFTREAKAWKSRQIGEGHVRARPSLNHEGEIYIGSLSVGIKQGDITREQADCIINSTNKELSLKNGAVSSAILKACGDDIQSQCAAKGAEMKRQGVISTTAEGLSCKYVIHVASSHFRDDWARVVSSCLHEARYLGDVQSVAFPLLGTGVGSVSPTKIADIMVDALNQFESNAGNVREITIVVFKDSDLDPFQSSFREAASRTGKAWNPGLQNIGPLSQGSVDLHFFSDDKKKIGKAIKYLEGKCSAELKTEEVKDAKIKDLTDIQIQALKRQFDVDITVDKSQGLLKITGLISEIGNVKAEVMKHLLTLEKQEGAAILARQIKWSFLEIQQGAPTQKHFDENQSAEIERQYQDNAKKHKVSQVGIEIDFSSMQGTRIVNGQSETLTVIRRNILDEVSRVSPPESWEPMDEKKPFSTPKLSPSSTEYSNVSQRFASTIRTNYTILEIRRIQNRTLYQQYVAKQSQMDKENVGTKNEQNLWHGTSADAIDSINKYGFNKGYCGKNATAIGQGAYFAVNASYSASSTYSVPDPSGHKHMYLCKVLTGTYTPGKSEMRVPPPKPGSTGNTDIFDSVTDNVNTPSMFVIFNDTQAYPEYLLSFTCP